MVNEIIAKTNGKDKVIDFRDGLSLANDEHYAMMHGVGGKDHAPNSVIKVTICDFTRGTGESSVTVSANITPDVINVLTEVCKKNMGTAMVVDSDASDAQNTDNAKELLTSTDAALKKARDIMQKNFQRKSQEAMVTATDMVELGRLIALIKKNAEGANIGSTPAQQVPSAISIDFDYKQDKVNPYKKDAAGMAPVSRLTIKRQGVRKDGTLNNYPWTFKIINGIAPVLEKTTGATTFDAQKIKNTTEAYILVSDKDVFRMMHRISRFVEVWENANCIPLVIRGLKLKEDERAAYAASRT